MSRILSASTFTSTSSKAFSLGSTTSTSSSQYSAVSKTNTSRAILSELIDSEATYLNDLKIIDSKIASLWMKQTTQAAPDFTELIKNTRDIILANKRFYMRLARCAGNTHAARDLGNILIQWVSDLKEPYSNYARTYIPNLNDRKDILANVSIVQLLKDLSRAASYDISLDSLFYAPIRHLKYYQDIYNRFLDAEPYHYDINDLTKAAHNLKAILAITQQQLASKSGSSASPQMYSQSKTSAHQTTTDKKASFIGQEEDFFSYYTEAGDLPPQGSVDHDSAAIDRAGSSYLDSNGYSHDDDEDLSTIQPRTVKILNTVSADPKMATVAASTTTTSSRSPAKVDTSAQIQMTYIQPKMATVTVLDDESSLDGNQQKQRSTNDSNRNVSANTQVTDSIPTSAPQPPKMQTQDPTPTSSTPSRSPTPPTPGSSSSNQIYTTGTPATTPPPHQQKALSPPANEPARPISPRAVQVQQAIKPVAAMQALPQKTNDYFGATASAKGATKPLPTRKDSANPVVPERSSSATVLPRTSSIRGSVGMMTSTSPTMQTTAPPSPSKPYDSQTPIVAHSQSHQQPRSLSLLRSSSLKSAEQLGHSTHPPHRGANGHLPPRVDSNNAHPIPSRSTHAATTTTATNHYQQQPSPVVSPHLSTPPDDEQQNNVRQVMYSNNLCEVFHWKDQSWYAVDGQCTVQIRLTYGGRSNVAVLLQPSGQLYLNVWILPNMVVGQPSPTDISISATMMEQQENYLVHFTHPTDASNLLAMLHRMHHEASRQLSQPPSHPSMQPKARAMRPEAAAVQLHDDTPSVEDVPQTLKPIYQCKCKLFVQNETSKWNPLGNTAMRISQQLPSQKTHVYIEDDKNMLISSIIRSGNVERLANKRITFLLTDDHDKSSKVYMIQLKDEQNGNRVFDYLKTQNAAHGW